MSSLTTGHGAGKGGGKREKKPIDYIPPPAAAKGLHEQLNGLCTEYVTSTDKSVDLALEQINIANKIEKVRAMMLLAADEKTPYWKIINVKAHFWECYVLTVVEASGVAARFTLSCAQWCKNLTQFNKLLAHREIFTEKERANFNQEGGYQVLSPDTHANSPQSRLSPADWPTSLDFSRR